MATDNKYDRQLRLWGKEGQRCLARANILVLGAGPIASETMKNLVLPGIGRFTVVDGSLVTATDLGNNFFVDPEFLGRPRAEAVTAFLTEMNPEDCIGAFRVADPAALVASEPEFFETFSLILTTQLPEAPLETLAQICWKAGVPLVVVRSNGMLATLRLQLPNHEIIESKPDIEFHDFRIANPFPELDQHCSEYDLEALGDQDHAHTPYVVLLMHALQRWKETHEGCMPKTFPEKKEFKAMIQGMARKLKEPELNFEEAVAQAHRAYAPVELSEHLVACCNAAKERELRADSSDFRFLSRALVDFMDAEGQGLPPVTGTIPDMEADTSKYVQLQKVYANKAAQDVEAIAARVVRLLEEQGRPADAISREGIERFCRNAWNIRVLNTRSIAEELANPILDPDSIFDMSQEELQPQAGLLWYIALRGADRFQREQGRLPGQAGLGAEALEAEAEVVFGHMQALVQQAAVEEGLELLSKDHAREVVRFGGSELHNTAAVIGGMASQEVIKILTHQWVPANNTVVFNGVAGLLQTLVV